MRSKLFGLLTILFLTGGIWYLSREKKQPPKPLLERVTGSSLPEYRGPGEHVCYIDRRSSALAVFYYDDEADGWIDSIHAGEEEPPAAI